MKKEDALVAFSKCEKKLLSVTDDILEDGVDSEDREQNTRFCRECDKIDDVYCTLSKLEDIDGIKHNELESMWNKSWNNMTDTHLPEVRCNALSEYIRLVKEKLS